MRVLIADDHSAFRASLRAFLMASPDVEMVGEAADGDQAARLAIEFQPHVVLLDLRMPGSDGVAVA